MTSPGLVRLRSAANDVAHVVPPSFEYDSWYRCDCGPILDHSARTRIDLPFTVSWPNSTPLPSLNSPKFADDDKVPTLLLTNDWLHWCARGLYRNSVNPSQCPFGPSASISSSSALPFQIGRTVTVPSNATDGLPAANG